MIFSSFFFLKHQYNNKETTMKKRCLEVIRYQQLQFEQEKRMQEEMVYFSRKRLHGLASFVTLTIFAVIMFAITVYSKKENALEIGVPLLFLIIITSWFAFRKTIAIKPEKMRSILEIDRGNGNLDWIKSSANAFYVTTVAIWIIGLTPINLWAAIALWFMVMLLFSFEFGFSILSLGGILVSVLFLVIKKIFNFKAEIITDAKSTSEALEVHTWTRCSRSINAK